jgi:pSer/pThr/pTyr-binding forkhead associated (FHA) protein
MLAIAINALYTTLRKRGTTRQLAGVIVSSALAALLLLPALFWYMTRFSVAQTSHSSLEIGLLLAYVALCGWVAPFGITTAYCLFARPRDSSTAGRLPGQRKRTTKARAEAINPAPPRRQPGVVAPYVYSADAPWGLLEYRNGKFLGQELALKRSIVSLGREEDNEVWLDDDTISRYHAELAWDKGQVYVTDNDSLNGVLLNGRRIRTSMLVKPGDELEVGGHRFALKYTPQMAKLDELDDPLLPQLLRASQARSAGSGPSVHEKKSQAGPTVALEPQQEDLPPFRDDDEDIAWQRTVEIEQRRPLSLTARSDGFCLVLNGELAGRSFLLNLPVLTVGRSSECNIVLDDLSVAPCHAQFARRADGDYVQDLASLIGSQVNGEPLNAPRRLRPGDILRLGYLELEYNLVEEAATKPMPLPMISESLVSFPQTLRLPSKFID